MNDETPEIEPVTLEEFNEYDYDALDWNAETINELIQRTDCFQVRNIARSILQGKLSGELSDNMYDCITQNCFSLLAQVIDNALRYMRLANRDEFRIEDFKNGLAPGRKVNNLPLPIILDDSSKFALHNFP